MRRKHHKVLMKYPAPRNGRNWSTCGKLAGNDEDEGGTALARSRPDWPTYRQVPVLTNVGVHCRH